MKISVGIIAIVLIVLYIIFIMMAEELYNKYIRGKE